MEKGCEVYRLYSDNTEGLCVDAKEIADHAAKGGMLGISKESWMAALEKMCIRDRKKLLTYPRTDSQFITDDMEDTARQVIFIVCRQLPLFSGVSVTPDRCV